MIELRRLGTLMAPRVEVAIVFSEMVGAADPAAYMTENKIWQNIAERVQADMTRTRATDGAIAWYCQHDPEAAFR